MQNTKRTRGRPVGTGKDDRANLIAVADRLAANPSMRPMTAMGIVVDHFGLGHSRDSAVRRLKRKWDRQDTALLAAARQRLAEQQMRRAAEAAAAYVEGFNKFIRSPAVTALVGKMELYARVAEQFAHSPKVAAFIKEMDDRTRRIQEVATILGQQPAWARLLSNDMASKL